MSSVPGIQTALHGLQESLRRFDETATRLARETATGNLDSVADDFVEMSIAKAGVATNVAVARSADEMTGSLLDVLV